MATEKRKMHRVVDANGTLVQVLPETSAEQVTLADAGNKFTSTNVEGALQELATSVASAGKVYDVKDVNGASIVTNKIAKLSKAAVGLGNVDNTADANKSVKHATSADSATKATKDGAGNIILDTYATKQALQDAISGKAKSFSYDDYQKFVEAVNAFSNTQMAVNDNVLIVTLGVPDMWVKAKNATSVTYTYTTDQAIINALNTTAGLTVGYYTFAQLETTKVDLSAYQTKTDNSLNTTSKTVVGAINEVKGTADSALTKANTNATEITNIKNGTTKVKSAEHADTADSATSAGTATNATNATNVTTNINGKAISSIFESNGTTVKKATSAGTADKVKNVLSISGLNGNLGEGFSYNGESEKSLDFHDDDFDLAKTTLTGYTVSLKNTGVTAGQYSAVNVDSKGRVTAGGKSIEWGTSGQTTPSDDLMIGGLFMELQ